MTLKKYIIPSLPGRQEDDLSLIVDRYNTAFQLLAQAMKDLRDEYASVKNRPIGATSVTTGSSGSGGGSSSTSKDHHKLTNLNVYDDHERYAQLAGRTSGQTLKGGVQSGANLTLQSTSHATRGNVKSNDDFGVPEDKKIIYDVE